MHAQKVFRFQDTLKKTSCGVFVQIGKLIFPCPRSCLRIWSRETGSAVPSRVSLLISMLRLNLVLTHGIPPDFRGDVHLFIPPYAIGSQSRVYQIGRSLPRVRRHRIKSPLGSSRNGCCLCITVDQLICASLSHTHYWYEVGILKSIRRVDAWNVYIFHTVQSYINSYKQYIGPLQICRYFQRAHFIPIVGVGKRGAY